MSKAQQFLEMTSDEEIKQLKKQLDQERQMGKATLAHSKSAEGVAVQQVLNKFQKFVVPYVKNLEEFEKVKKLTPQTLTMMMNIVKNLKNGLRSCGVQVR